MQHLRNGRRRIVAMVLLVVASGSRCVLDDGGSKNRCVTDDDCLGARFCSEGFCRDDVSGLGGSAGMDDGGNGGVPGASGDAGRATGGSGRGGGSGDSGNSGVSGDSAGGGSGLGGTAGTGAGEGGMGASFGCPEMVLLPDGFCIDSTEVTRGAYRTWLLSNPQVTPAAGCESNESFETCGVWNDGSDDLPATCIDWCDAEAYCRDNGKRLCGLAGEGPANYATDYVDSERSEWFAACSSSGLYDYPYGNASVRELCADFTSYAPVASMVGCHGPSSPYDCVFDLSGNAWEWEDSCTDDTETASCRLRGGGIGGQGPVDFSCAADNSAQRTGGSYIGVGFRCCSDVCSP